MPERLILPFNVLKEGLDTGIAVVNTSETAGEVTLFLFTDTTNGLRRLAVRPDEIKKGSGLDESGHLPPRGTYSVLY